MTVETMSGTRIVVRVDASERIGSGHVMRCLSLAGALARRGAEVLFVCAELPLSLERRIEQERHRVLRIAGCDSEAATQSWDGRPMGDELQRHQVGATAATLDGRRADWIVVDHYRLGAAFEAGSRSFANRCLVIDDLANRPHDCDILVDQTFGRQARSYAHLVPPACRLCLGSLYAMLRPEFRTARKNSLRRRLTPSAPTRILIALGATDVGAFSLPAASAVLALLPEMEVDLVVGSDAPTRPRLEDFAAREPRLRLHVDASNMAELTASADLGLGASGTSAWERCCLGLPTVAVVLAQNQRLVAAELGRVGACIVAKNIEDAATRLAGLANDGRARDRMIAAAAALVDGAGTIRVIDAMLGGEDSPRADREFAVRAATAADAERAWLWRNDPVTRASSQTTDPIAWSDHLVWWTRSISSASRLILIAESDQEPVAVLRYDRLPDAVPAYEISIYLRPDLRGAGFGSRILELGCTDLLRRLGPLRFEASIRRENVASCRIFERVGFRHAGPLGESGFDRYVRPAKPDGAGE